IAHSKCHCRGCKIPFALVTDHRSAVLERMRTQDQRFGVPFINFFRLPFSVWSAQKMRSGIRTEEYG
ncbi:unnamed protein product, partial [Allacma fusca]